MKNIEYSSIPVNTCIKTVTIKKVVKGRIRGREWGGNCYVMPYNEGVYLNIGNQTFNKVDIKHLIDSLTEIHEVLE